MAFSPLQELKCSCISLSEPKLQTINIIESPLQKSRDFTPSPSRSNDKKHRSMTQIKLDLKKPEKLMRITFMESQKTDDSHLVPPNMLVESFAREFKLLESLGKGNQAEVFKVQKRQTGEILAAKIYNTREEERVLMIKREAEILRMLNNPEILHFRGFEEDDTLGNYVIITEFFEGIPLEDFLKKYGHISVQEKRHVLDQILTSLMYLYEKSVAHGDFNLKNILISPSDNFGVKIIDFGLARQTDFKEDCEDLLTPQGNHKYRPPKCNIFQNSFACDLWGFGLVALSVLTQKKVTTKKAIKMIEEEKGQILELEDVLKLLELLMKSQDYDGVMAAAMLFRKLF